MTAYTIVYYRNNHEVDREVFDASDVSDAIWHANGICSCIGWTARVFEGV